MSAAPAVSVVVPVYQCAQSIELLHARVAAALDLVWADFELVFIDDRAPDGAWDVIRTLSERDVRVRGVRLSRNFGQQAAITAGIEHSRGARIVVMDCDLQDPPEEIPRLLAKAEEGYDIVFGRRMRKSMAGWRRWSGHLYFRLLNMFAGAEVESQRGAFSVISREVADRFLELGDHDRHYILILNWLGFDRATIDYEHADRLEGQSSYGLFSLVRLAFDGMFFQTTVLLRWIVYAGFAFAAAGVAFAVYVVISRLTESYYPGWASLAVFTLFIGGFIILSTGITGLYIGKVFEQVKGRPLFVVAETLEDGTNLPGAGAPQRQPDPADYPV